MAERRVTGATRRARQMMIGGLLTGHAAGIAACGLALATGSRAALIGAALGFAAVVIFCSVSYAVRVVGVGAGIWFVTSHPQLGPATDRNWLAAAVIATVLAWTTGVVVVASRQRVPIYDIHDQG